MHDVDYGNHTHYHTSLTLTGRQTVAVIGWDIGGVNTKVARVERQRILNAHTEPYEIQRNPERLPSLLLSLADGVGVDHSDAHAVTMTAELSQLFRAKRDGVHFVLTSLSDAFPNAAVHIMTVDGLYISAEAAKAQPLAVAASNWAATAWMIAQRWANAVLIDVGTTTTDVIPIVGGRVVARGRTDPERLRTGELLYVGVVRTPVEAIVHEVPLDGGMAGVSAEGFALAADVHTWRGDLPSTAYDVATPDSRAVTREFVGERLARIVCGDREMVPDHDLDRITAYVADAHVARTATACTRACRDHQAIHTAVAAGVGEFIAVRVAERLGFRCVVLSRDLGADASRAAPAASVALLLEQHLAQQS